MVRPQSDQQGNTMPKAPIEVEEPADGRAEDDALASLRAEQRLLREQVAALTKQLAQHRSARDGRRTTGNGPAREKPATAQKKRTSTGARSKP